MPRLQVMIGARTSVARHVGLRRSSLLQTLRSTVVQLHSQAKEFVEQARVLLLAMLEQ